MSIPILGAIPEEMTVGDTIKFTKALDDFPFSESWTYTYYFVKDDGTANIFNVVATQPGSSEEYLITITPAKTSSLASGRYDWRAKVEKAGEVSTIEESTIQLLPSYTAAVESRTPARQIVDAIDAQLAGSATLTQKRIKVKDREIEHHDRNQLLQLRSYYDSIALREEAAERLALGLGQKHKMRTRLLNN